MPEKAQIQLGLHKHVRKKPVRLLLPSLVISMMYLRERKKNSPPLGDGIAQRHEGSLFFFSAAHSLLTLLGGVHLEPLVTLLVIPPLIDRGG